MPVLGIDLGGTKISFAIIDDGGNIMQKETVLLEKRAGTEVAGLLLTTASQLLAQAQVKITAIGISVPGIFRQQTGTVWAPNISGWEDYHLLKEAQHAFGSVPVFIDCDRACYILGEVWKGNAQGARHAIYLAVGTGIGAGILVDGKVLRGAHDIAGAIGWMALSRPFKKAYEACGYFESFASGQGIARLARHYNFADEQEDQVPVTDRDITAHHIFEAFQRGNPEAAKVLEECVELWGMAAANLVSLFNPEKIIFGGGVFGPATALIPRIQAEASKWAQPISIQQVHFEPSALGADAGVYGAAFLALQNSKQKSNG